MAEINANIVVEPIILSITETSPALSVTVDSTAVNVYAGGFALPGGANTQLQYNNAGRLGGIANTVFSGGNVSFTNLANLKIDGGTNGYFLQTDGTGALSWNAGTSTPGTGGTPGGAATQVQYNDGTSAFAGAVGFTYDVATGDVTMGDKLTVDEDITSVTGNIDSTAGVFNGDGGGLSNIAAANVVGALSAGRISNGTSNVDIATVNGNITVGVGGTADVLIATTTGVNVTGTLNATGIITGDGGGLSNIAGANVSGTVPLSTYATTANAVAGANVSGAVDFATTANAVAGANVSGEVSFAATANTVAGANVSGTVALATTAGTVTTAAQPNITTVGTLSSLTVNGTTTLQSTTILQQAEEKFTPETTGAGGTLNYNLLDQAIVNNTGIASANTTLNFRGNSTTTANTMITNDHSVTATYLVTTGASAYGITDVNIDSASQLIRWAGNVAPTQITNTITSYTFNLIKTADNVYTVFGSATRYG